MNLFLELRNWFNQKGLMTQLLAITLIGVSATTYLINLLHSFWVFTNLLYLSIAIWYGILNFVPIPRMFAFLLDHQIGLFLIIYGVMGSLKGFVDFRVSDFFIILITYLIVWMGVNSKHD